MEADENVIKIKASCVNFHHAVEQSIRAFYGNQIPIGIN